MRVKWRDAVQSGKYTLFFIVTKHSQRFRKKLSNERITEEKEWLKRNYPDVYKIVK